MKTEEGARLARLRHVNAEVVETWCWAAGSLFANSRDRETGPGIFQFDVYPPGQNVVIVLPDRYFTSEGPGLASELTKNGHRESWNAAPVLRVTPNPSRVLPPHDALGKPNINRKEGGKKPTTTSRKTLLTSSLRLQRVLRRILQGDVKIHRIARSFNLRDPNHRYDRLSHPFLGFSLLFRQSLLRMQEELSGLHVFFLFPGPISRRRKPLLRPFSLPPFFLPRAIFPPVTWTCVRTFVRVHYKHVHRRGVSRRNIDVLLKLNRIDDKNDDVPRSAPPFPLARFVRRRRYRCRLGAQSRRVRRCVFAQAHRVFFFFFLLLVSPRGPGALAAGKSNPKARQTMRSPSEAPAATRSVCGNIYTEVACTRPSLRPCILSHGSQSPPRFLKIRRDIGSVDCYIINMKATLRSCTEKEVAILKIACAN